jgi:hypothetical protein
VYSEGRESYDEGTAMESPADSRFSASSWDQPVLAAHGWNLGQEEIVRRFMGRTLT